MPKYAKKNTSQHKWGAWRDNGLPPMEFRTEREQRQFLFWKINRVYSVMAFRGVGHFPTYDATEATLEESIVLEIQRRDCQPVHSWWDFQFIKNDLVGEERTAVEMYPPQQHVIDPVHMYFLWVLPEGFFLPYLMRQGKEEK